MKLNGKRILITGGARRGGAALAKHFAAAGAVIALHFNRSADDAAKLLASLNGTEHSLHQADFAIPGEAERLAAEVGRIDILINNASIFFRPGSPEDIAAEELYRRINFLAPQILLDSFAAQDLPEGCAVNILDQAVLNPGSGGYWHSRYELGKLTLQLAPGWGAKNFRINAVAPGPMSPPAWAPDSKMEKTLPMIPLHRPADENDFVAAVDFLCRCDSASGVILPIDCGMAAANRKTLSSDCGLIS